MREEPFSPHVSFIFPVKHPRGESLVLSMMDMRGNTTVVDWCNIPTTPRNHMLNVNPTLGLNLGKIFTRLRLTQLWRNRKGYGNRMNKALFGCDGSVASSHINDRFKKERAIFTVEMSAQWNGIIANRT